MFYNTGIGTFIWILSNKKEDRRKGKIQLIDASSFKTSLGRNMGKKNCELSPEQRRAIIDLFLKMEENEYSHIYNNSDFGYWYITVERPVRLRVYPNRSIKDAGLTASEKAAFESAIKSLSADTPLDDWELFAKRTGLKVTLLKKIRPYITEKDPKAKAVKNESDADLRDTEIIPFNYEGGIDNFMQTEVFPFAPDAWVNTTKTKIGYEIIFNKYFKKKINIKSKDEIAFELKESLIQANSMLEEIIGGEK